MTARSRVLGLGFLLAGCFALLIAYGSVLFLLPAWVVIAVGLWLLSRTSDWRRSALSGLALHVGLTLIALVATGATLGVAGRSIGGFDGVLVGDDWLLFTIGLLGAPAGASIALAFAPTRGRARTIARVGVALALVGVLGAVLSAFDPRWSALLGVPAILLAALTPVSAAWTLWDAKSASPVTTSA